MLDWGECEREFYIKKNYTIYENNSTLHNFSFFDRSTVPKYSKVYQSTNR